MVKIKETGTEQLNEIKKDSGEVLETAGEMRQQAEQVNSILEGITLNDADSVEILREVKQKYPEDFKAAAEKDIQAPAEEIRNRIAEQSGILEGELENVRGGIGQLERAQGITEIGREAAEAGREGLEKEVGEYSDTIGSLREVGENQDKEIAENAARMESLFQMSR